MDNKISLLTSPFVPEGMVDLMKKLSKAVIKERPSNIYEYAAAFFEKMLIERDGSLDKGYGKFRSYTEYCKFMDKMDQRRINQSATNDDTVEVKSEETQEEAVPPTNIEIQGIAIQGVERKSKDNVKNVSINPKYKSQSEKVMKPTVNNVKNVKTKPRKLSSKKPSENLIAIKEETSADVDDNGNGELKLNKAAVTIQKAFRTYLNKKNSQGEQFLGTSNNVSQMSEDTAAFIIQKAFKSLVEKLKALAGNESKGIVVPADDLQNVNNDQNSEQIFFDEKEKDRRGITEDDDQLQENTLEKTATASPNVETGEAEITSNVEAATILDSAESQQTSISDISATKSTCDDSNNQESVTSDDIESTDHGVALLTENELPECKQVDSLEVGSDDAKGNKPLGNESEDVNCSNNETDCPEYNQTEVIEERLSPKKATQLEERMNLTEDKAINGASSNENEIRIQNADLNTGVTVSVEETVQQDDRSRVEDFPSGDIQPTQENAIAVPAPEVDSVDRTDNFEEVSLSVSVSGAEEQGHANQGKEIASKEPETTHENTTTTPVPDLVDHNENTAEDSSNVTISGAEGIQMEKQDLSSQKEEISLEVIQLTHENLTNTLTQEKVSIDQIDDVENVSSNVTISGADAIQPENGDNVSDGKETDTVKTQPLMENVTMKSAPEVEKMDDEDSQTLEDTATKPFESPQKEQLFVVQDDGIYVNLDLLQEKLGTAVVDDGHSEKSFMLDILEREEILVNQENVQQIEDEPKATITDILDQSENVKNGEEIVEDVRSAETDFEIKDEDGNEEYELAETVVLVDIPLQHKTNRKNDDSEPATTSENIPADLMKSNKIESNGSQQNNLEKFSEPVKTVGVSVSEDAGHDKINSEKTIEEDAVIEETSAEKEGSSLTSSPEEVSSKNDEGTKQENIEQNNDNESTHESMSTAIVAQGSDLVNHQTNGTGVGNKMTKDDVNEKSDEKIDNLTSKDQEVISVPIETKNEDVTGCEPQSEIHQLAEVVIENEFLKNAENAEIPKVEIGSDVEICSEQLLAIRENEDLVKAATTIQKVFRGYIVRNSGRIPTKNKQDHPELAAALIIQKYARGYLVRRNMQKASKSNVIQVTSNQLTDDGNTEADSNTEAVPPLPPYSNRFLIPKDSFLERESFADDEDYARTCKELAATSIQKTYRGYRVRRSMRASTETDNDDASNDVKDGMESLDGNDQVQTVVNEAERVISAVLNVAADVVPLETYDSDTFEEEVNEDSKVEGHPIDEQKPSTESSVEHESVLGPIVQDNIHVEGQMQQKYNQLKFQGSPINPIEEMSDSSEQPETPRAELIQNTMKTATFVSESLDSKGDDGVKSFSYEQLSSDLSDTEEMKRESLKDSEVDETSRDERDDLSEVENFDLSSCGEDSLEAMYYSIRKNEIMLDRMQKQVSEQREKPSNEIVAADNFKVEFPERVTENLDAAMQQVFKSLETSSNCDGGKKDEDDNSSAFDLGLDDSSSINDDKEIETSRQIKRSDEVNLEDSEPSIGTVGNDDKDDNTYCSELNGDRDVETSNTDQGQQSDSSVNSSNRFIMKSQSVSEDMMNPIMYAMKRKQALLDQLHVRTYALQESPSEDHDAFPEHLLTDIDIGNIQRKIFASSVSETDSDYIEPNTMSRRLVRDDFNISTALDHLSSDSDSTIVSAATKIQAGARGFLTRRRLRRSSAGGTSISFEKRYSFGNAAIDKSLEDLIKRQEQITFDGAALKIQQQYRRYQARKKNLKKVSPIREQTTLELSGESSVDGMEGMDDTIGIREVTLAQKKLDSSEMNVVEKTHPISLNIDTVDTVEPVKRTPVNQRRLTLQRGDAVQRNSRPDSQELNVKDASHSSADHQTCSTFKDSETGEQTGSINGKREKTVTAYINIQSLINRGIGPRQRSMPVQIDSELMRIIPKHLRKRVKSADMAKKKKK